MEARGLAKSLRQSHSPYAEYFAFSCLHLSKVYDLCLVTQPAFPLKRTKSSVIYLGTLAFIILCSERVLFRTIFSSHINALAREICRRRERTRKKNKGRPQPGFSRLALAGREAYGPHSGVSGPFSPAVPCSRWAEGPWL